MKTVTSGSVFAAGDVLVFGERLAAVPGSPGPSRSLRSPFTIGRVVQLMDEAGVDRVVIVPQRRSKAALIAFSGRTITLKW
jgi:hypothetical protein